MNNFYLFNLNIFNHSIIFFPKDEIVRLTIVNSYVNPYNLHLNFLFVRYFALPFNVHLIFLTIKFTLI